MLFAASKNGAVAEKAKDLKPDGHDLGEQARHIFDSLRGKAGDATTAVATPVWSRTSDFVAGQVERGGKTAGDLSSRVADTAGDLSSRVADTAGDYSARAVQTVATKSQVAADIASKVVADVAASAAAAKKAAGKEMARRRPGAKRGPNQYAWVGVGAATILVVVAVVYRQTIWNFIEGSAPYKMVKGFFVHETDQPESQADGMAEMEMEA